MIQRRATAMALQGRINCHTFRAPGITVSLEAGGTRENAQAMAAHESPKTTTLYDRTGDAITLDEVERIKIEPPSMDRHRTVHRHRGMEEQHRP